MTDVALRALIREIVIEVLREYFTAERELSLSKATAIERMQGIRPLTSQLRKDAKAVTPPLGGDARG